MDEYKEAASFFWNVLSAVIGAILTLTIHAFKFGGKMESLLSKAEADRLYARKDSVEDLRRNVEALREEQSDDFRTVITLLGGHKD